MTEPGKVVKEGAPLVILSSAAVGLGGTKCCMREAELALAQKARSWGEEIAKNTQELLGQLKQRPALPELEKELAGKKLGDYREKIVGAYSKLILTELAIESADSLTEQGAVAKRIINERRRPAKQPPLLLPAPAKPRALTPSKRLIKRRRPSSRRRGC